MLTLLATAPRPEGSVPKSIAPPLAAFMAMKASRGSGEQCELFVYTTAAVFSVSDVASDWQHLEAAVSDCNIAVNARQGLHETSSSW